MAYDTSKPLTVKIAPQDVGDFYYMVRWYTRNRANTFAYLLAKLNEIYPSLPQAYGDTAENQ